MGGFREHSFSELLMIAKTNDIPAYPPGPVNLFASFGCTMRHLPQMAIRPLEFATELREKYGRISFFRIFGAKFYMVNDPDAIHEVLVANKSKFRKVERQMRTIRPVVGRGILTSDGEFWLRQRRLLQKAFSPQKLQEYSQGMIDQTDKLLDHWDGLGDKPQIDVTLEMMRLTLGIATRAFFGEQPKQREENLAWANHELSEAFTSEMLSVVHAPKWVPLPSRKRKQHAIDTYVAEVRQLIREKRASNLQSDDLLTAVLKAVDDEGDGTGMTDEQALDELLTIYIAGHHTTSVALSWTFYLLAKHRDVEQRLLDEVDQVVGDRPVTMADLANMPYTEMVVKESLRLHPPAYVLFAREALEDIVIGGQRIEKGGWVYMYPYVMHRDPALFENPLAFDPERFSPERIGSIPKNAYIPFGLGPHVCIGQRFAMIEFMLAVPTILRRYRMEIKPGHENAKSRPLLANHIKGGLPVTLVKRERKAPPAKPIATPMPAQPASHVGVT